MEAIELKEAAKKGVDFLISVYEGAEDILVEEVDIDEQQKTWFITYSYLFKRKQVDHSPISTIGTSLSLLYPSRERNYKTLKIDAKTGAVLSMKIRELQG